MTARERFRRQTHFQSIDRNIHWKFWYLPETLERWHAEGREKRRQASPEEYFGVAPILLYAGAQQTPSRVSGKIKILKELKRVEKLLKTADISPHGDHRIPQDVPYENYRYYIGEKLTMLGWQKYGIDNVEGLPDDFSRFSLMSFGEFRVGNPLKHNAFLRF